MCHGGHMQMSPVTVCKPGCQCMKQYCKRTVAQSTHFSYQNAHVILAAGIRFANTALQCLQICTLSIEDMEAGWQNAETVRDKHVAKKYDVTRSAIISRTFSTLTSAMSAAAPLLTVCRQPPVVRPRLRTYTMYHLKKNAIAACNVQIFYL
jgi:esterase/lipase superfamily enzyme